MDYKSFIAKTAERNAKIVALDAAGTPLADWASSQIGVKYSLSKRTLVYGYTGTSTNNLVTATSTSANTGTFRMVTGTLMGIDHQF